MSRVQGAASFRRLLKRLPDSSRDQLKQLLQQAGPKLASDMKARVPVLASPHRGRTPGALRNGISFRVTPGLSLRVGLLNTRRGRSELFYGHILDVGRRAQTVSVNRRLVAGSALVHGRRVAHPSYSMQVTRLQPLWLVYRGLQDFKREFLPDYTKLAQAILLDAARGAGTD